MKRRVNRTAGRALVIAVLVALGAYGCGSDPPTGPGEPSGRQVLFYSQARNVTPVFLPGAPPRGFSTHEAPAISPGWDNGNPVRMLFDLLQNFEHPADQGRIDSHNLYKVLFDAGAMFEAARSSPSNRTFPAASVAATFDLGTTPGTYDNGGVSTELGSNGVTYHKSWAYRVEPGRTVAVLTWIYDISATHQERGVIEAALDDATGDIELNMANHVWYSDTEWFSIRTWVAGNTATHAFTIKGLNRGQSSYGASYASFAGAGVSRGAGEYFLFRVRVVNGDTDEGVFSYKIPADADEDVLKALPATGEPAGFDETNDPTDYRALIPATLFAVTDAPGSAGDFDNGNTLRLP